MLPVAYFEVGLYCVKVSSCVAVYNSKGLVDTTTGHLIDFFFLISMNNYADYILRYIGKFGSSQHNKTRGVCFELTNSAGSIRLSTTLINGNIL